MDYQVITRERHGQQYWLKRTGYTFAAEEALCPLVAQEMPKAALSLPIGFVAEAGQFTPVAVQGLTSGQNLLVTATGRWQAGYIPAHYRGYPFRMLPTVQGATEAVLCIDEASNLLSESAGETFFDEDGSPSESVREILQFFSKIETNRQLTGNICAVLQRHGLIQPWPISLGDEQTVQGLFRIDEVALNALNTEALSEIHSIGGLTFAYCQLLSMHHLGSLYALKDAHIEAQKALQAQAASAENGAAGLGFLNEGGTFSFGNLS